MNITREWAMPTGDTHKCIPIGKFIRRYLEYSLLSVDVFSRNCGLADITNDINPETASDFHLDACEFLYLLLQEKIFPDLVIFDPPFSRNQVKSVYGGIGRHYGVEDSRNHSANWRKERDIVDSILCVGGVVLSFGWNSSGMGKTRGYELEEILLVCHGGGHNDTICIAERKIAL